MSKQNWESAWNDITTNISNAKSGVTTFVDEAYSAAQTGEINTAELLNPADRAKLLSEQQDVPQAIADLQALNIPTDLGSTATVEVDLPNGTAIRVGTLGSSSDSFELQAGKTYDPANLSETVYLTHDLAKASYEWTSFQSGIDGGVVTLTSEPPKNRIVRIQTSDGETINIDESELSRNGSGNYEYDASTDLENDISSVNSVTLFPDVSDTNYVNTILKEQFTIKKIVGEDGNSLGKVNFQRDDPHTDTNYISEEEWSKRREKYDKLIEKYQDSQASGGGGFLNFGGSGLLSGGIPTIAILGGAGYLAWDTFFND
jgi:hypothetical protein